MGLDPNSDYPSNKGGEKIPLIVHYDNGYSILSTLTPALKDMEYVSPIFNNDILAHNVANTCTRPEPFFAAWNIYQVR